VTRDNSPPFSPIGPVLQAGSETTDLVWAIPDPQDPDSGDAIDFFRIYRDGTSISDRYDRVAGTVSSYTDFKSAGESHSYWVTAVDGQLGESAPIQAVPAG
jgi:fibronectin type 3 domain-containing protein